jgi:hypothetical protein
VLPALTVATVLIGLTVCAFALLNMHDRRMEARMPDPRPMLRTHLRDYLGITEINDRMETAMSEITDALNRLAAQVSDVSAAQATSFSNLQTAINELKAGKLDAQQREIVGRIESALTKLGEDAQVADDGYEPVQPETPADPEVPGQPVEETQTDPAVETPAVEDRSNR